MSIQYPIFAFEKDDNSMRIIEDENKILYHLEPIDIENDEYIFWDANGDGLTVAIAANGKFEGVSSSYAAMPILEAFRLYGIGVGLSGEVTGGTPLEAWRCIQAQLAARRKKRSLFSRLFLR